MVVKSSMQSRRAMAVFFFLWGCSMLTCFSKACGNEASSGETRPAAAAAHKPSWSLAGAVPQPEAEAAEELTATPMPSRAEPAPPPRP